ncbi:MAG: hypothetical protein NZO58_03305, partial [Gemmataceae bacterium]|nr:hypothetical protein [Gemmataceae bacterium]
KKIYTKTSEFKLPIQMDERTRATLERVCLYVKSGSGDWVRQDEGPATQPYFIYRVPQDGEYWFSLVTIDKSGRMTPADVGQEPPSLRVVVDTRPPVIDAQTWVSPEGDLCLRCNLVDANPEPKSLRATVRVGSTERALLPYNDVPGTFKIAGPDMDLATITVTAQDLSGNTATKEVRLRELVGAAGHPGPVPHAAGSAGATVSSLLARTDLPPLPPSVAAPTGTAPPVLPSALAQPPLPQLPTSHHLRPEYETNRLVGGARRQLINTTRAVLDYRIDQVGPSGVGKVEVYMTADQGLTWHRLGEDPDRRSPIEFELPSEGVFGIRLAITNGNGFGGAPPARGDMPTCYIEVDTTPPFVQLRPVEPIIANGTLEIRWHASDKNIGPDPVTLYYRTRIDSPWQVIARRVRNDGAYPWPFPRDAGSQFFLRVEVTDLAGNVAFAETPNPVLLDTTEPRATVISVSGLSARPGP